MSDLELNKKEQSIFDEMMKIEEKLADRERHIQEPRDGMHALYLDYREKSHIKEASSHEFVRRLDDWIEMQCTRYANARFPEHTEALKDRVDRRIFNDYQKFRLAAQTSPKVTHHAYYFASFDENKSKLNTYFYKHYLQFSWKDVVRADLREQRLIHEELYGKDTYNATHHLNARTRVQFESYEVLAKANDEDAALTTSDAYTLLPHLEIAKARLDHDHNLFEYSTPHQTPIRVRRMVKAFQDFGQALYGVPAHDGSRVNQNDIDVWNCMWGLVPGRHEEFLNLSIKDIAAQLGRSESTIKNHKTKVTQMWFHPPEDQDTDDDNIRAKKASLRILSAACMQLAMPTRLRNIKRDPHATIAGEKLRQLLQTGKTTVKEGQGVGLQPFDQTRRLFFQALEHLSTEEIENLIGTPKENTHQERPC